MGAGGGQATRKVIGRLRVDKSPFQPISLTACFTYQARKRHQGGRVSLSEVIIHDDENFERALKRFKKKCEKAGILSDLRKHRHYEKPSERRKRKLNAAIRKNRRTRHG
jgi:small subunit ribosomal protein S21